MSKKGQRGQGSRALGLRRSKGFRLSIPGTDATVTGNVQHDGQIGQFAVTEFHVSFTPCSSSLRTFVRWVEREKFETIFALESHGVDGIKTFADLQALVVRRKAGRTNELYPFRWAIIPRNERQLTVLADMADNPNHSFPELSAERAELYNVSNRGAGACPAPETRKKQTTWREQFGVGTAGIADELPTDTPITSIPQSFVEWQSASESRKDAIVSYLVSIVQLVVTMAKEGKLQMAVLQDMLQFDGQRLLLAAMASK